MNHPHQAVMDILFGRWRSQILYAGVKLGVLDALGAGPRGLKMSRQSSSSMGPSPTGCCVRSPAWGS